MKFSTIPPEVAVGDVKSINSPHVVANVPVNPITSPAGKNGHEILTWLPVCVTPQDDPANRFAWSGLQVFGGWFAQGTNRTGEFDPFGLNPCVVTSVPVPNRGGVPEWVARNASPLELMATSTGWNTGWKPLLEDVKLLITLYTFSTNPPAVPPRELTVGHVLGAEHAPMISELLVNTWNTSAGVDEILTPVPFRFTNVAVPPATRANIPMSPPEAEVIWYVSVKDDVRTTWLVGATQ